MATRANRRTYPDNPAVPTSPAPSVDAGPQITIDVQSLIIAQGPPRLDATARVNPPPRFQELELFTQIQRLANAKQCPDLLLRAQLKIQVALLQPDREQRLVWMTGAYDDLLQASLIAAQYTFDETVKNTWLGQIQTTYATLKAYSVPMILDPKPVVPEPPVPVPPKSLVRQLIISKVAGGIITLLGLVLIAGIGIHRLRVMKYIS